MSVAPLNRELHLIVAAHFPTMGIGRDGQLPWRIADDLANYVKVTTNCAAGKMNAVIMGRKTWSSIPLKFRPLKGRKNVVLTNNVNARQEFGIPEDVIVAASLEDGLDKLEATHLASSMPIDKIFVIGGESLYQESLASPLCGRIYLTEVHGNFPPFDVFFPAISAQRFIITRKGPLTKNGDLAYRFCEFRVCPDVLADSLCTALRSATDYSSNPEEGQYLSVIEDIMTNGALRGDRTGTGTLSKFGVQMRFSLRDGSLPLITTKKVFWRGVTEELLWFVKGCTNANELREKGIHIWDGNASKEFLESRGLGHREEGDLGPVYGFQWRHFGAEYKDFTTDYTGQGVDQLKQCVHTIKTNPTDRRIVMTAWNPKDLDLMALPPCHMFCQFYVANGELSCQMYQRSADMGLGVPFNIASYALLTHMMAHVCGLAAGDLVHTIGDAHVYCNHVDALREQVTRRPKPFPKLMVKRPVSDIDGFAYDDFDVLGYKFDAAIKMKMAV